MIYSITHSEISADAFPDIFHHVIPRSFYVRHNTEVEWLTDGAGNFACYHPHTGFCLTGSAQNQLLAWAQWLYARKITLMAGERHLHFQLLQTLGTLGTAHETSEILCRFEFQDFCFHNTPLAPLTSAFQIKQATQADTEKLFYFYKCSETMEARSKESLKQTIQQDKLFYIHKLGKIISAALTHCETPEAALIGGVYTPGRYRGKGYAKTCVHALMSALKAEQKIPCLFYEQNNQAARALYKSLGFQAYGEWVIAELIYPTSA